MPNSGAAAGALTSSSGLSPRVPVQVEQVLVAGDALTQHVARDRLAIEAAGTQTTLMRMTRCTPVQLQLVRSARVARSDVPAATAMQSEAPSPLGVRIGSTTCLLGRSMMQLHNQGFC
jgi:hypothetical protein